MNNFSIPLEDFQYYNFLLSIKNIGPKRFKSIVDKFPSIYELKNVSYQELLSVDLITQNIAQNLFSSIGKYESIIQKFAKDYEFYINNNIKIIPYWADNYPKLLKEIYDPPVIIYIKGELEIQDDYAVAIVGTRMPTPYGKNQTAKFTKVLIDNNITIVSGLARGIDTITHKTVVENNGRTIAVIGSGIDVHYPAENKYLYEKIAENGAIITEFPLGTYPDPENFPRRNRIITGLSVATLIVESRLNGGAMISANFAFDQNREVYAIPGNINSEMSKGPNYLIQNNKAKLVTCAEDIISDLGLKIKPKVKDISQFNLGMFELSIYENLSNEPIHIDEIATKVNISVSDCLVSLLNLEFEGLIKQLPGKYFIKV